MIKRKPSLIAANLIMYLFILLSVRDNHPLNCFKPFYFPRPPQKNIGLSLKKLFNENIGNLGKFKFYNSRALAKNVSLIYHGFPSFSSSVLINCEEIFPIFLQWWSTSFFCDSLCFVSFVRMCVCVCFYILLVTANARRLHMLFFAAS